MLDWSVNAALLFGRQKAKTSHSTQAQEEYISYSRLYMDTWSDISYGYRTSLRPEYSQQSAALAQSDGAQYRRAPSGCR